MARIWSTSFWLAVARPEALEKTSMRHVPSPTYAGGATAATAGSVAMPAV